MTAIRFRFGENWLSYVDTVTPQSIRFAEDALARLLPRSLIAGRRFLDIGCGAGLSALAALRLGAAQVEGIDIDPQSVEAARRLLEREAAGGAWSVARKSVFELDPRDGRFEIVHSWGVLHHTGAMWEATEKAARMVAPGGWLVIALYRKTPLCALWRREKRLYAASGPRMQRLMRRAYTALFAAGLMATGRCPKAYVARYRSARGMSWEHDVHDWLGGYPYESAEPGAVISFLDRLGFRLERVFERPAAACGLFGTHCDEYVFRSEAELTAAAVGTARDTDGTPARDPP